MKWGQDPQAIACIYALSAPGDPTIRYIDQTARSLDERLRGHIIEARGAKRHSARTHWVKRLVDSGLTPVIALIETTTLAESNAIECRYIKELEARGLPLLTMNHSARSREIHRQTALRQWQRRKATIPS